MLKCIFNLGFIWLQEDPLPISVIIYKSVTKNMCCANLNSLNMDPLAWPASPKSWSIAERGGGRLLSADAFG